MASSAEDCSSGNETDGDIVYRTAVDPKNGTELSTGVLMALDAIPGYDIENSESVVFEHVDLEAVDQLFTTVDGTQRQGQVTFPVDRYQITVTAAGEITIRAR